MDASPWKSTLTRLLGIAATPVLVLLLVVTIIGIPLVAVVALLVLAAGVLGFTALSFHVGRSLPLRVQQSAWVLQLAIGTAIVVLVTQIPIVGGLAWIAAALITFGAALRSRFGQGPVLPTTIAFRPRRCRRARTAAVTRRSRGRRGQVTRGTQAPRDSDAVTGEAREAADGRVRAVALRLRPPLPRLRRSG
jgi:hypothetical protein